MTFSSTSDSSAEIPSLGSETRTLRVTILLLVAALNIASTVAACAIAYRFQKNAFIHGVDRLLTAAAVGAQSTYGDEFHRQMFDGKQYTADEQLAEIRRLSGVTNELNLNYVASLVRRDGKYFYAISSSPDSELADGTYDRFWTKYDTVSPGLAASFEDGQPRFEEHVDDYGSFRSAYVPFSFPGSTKPDYIFAADLSLDYIYDHLHATLAKTAIAGIGIFIVSLWFTRLLANHVSGPMTRLAKVIRGVVKSDFQMKPEERESLADIAERSHAEVSQVAHAFCKVELRLQDYFAKLEQNAAERERINSELSIAHDIQVGLLPQQLPQTETCDLFARVIPAKEVGGDLFHVATFEDGRLMLVVADVSGKGIAAGLFMAMTKTLLDVALHYGTSPERIVTFLNNQLSADNEACMFVTLFLGIFNPKTGVLEFSNAGHNPPYIRREDGSVQMLVGRHGPALGIAPGYEFTSESVTIKSGDLLLMYSDGVTEAQDPAEKLFSEERLESCLHEMPNPTASDAVRMVIDEVAAFQGTAPQFDDITLLALRYTAPITAAVSTNLAAAPQ